eukprot:CAMPEP_0196683132 /NCGR_PEP_ID=MMETSP1090-20130531/9693_1 /TAXON_ID=37098 /ORGANISM="Isochrysis sp, Strain CCMP1244" /LENGTH=77 /DNA_ID=CAMNT_0042021565 /DNA_START=146 /DNA_END=374 /DNA_ORIENTATION=-
MVRVVRACLHMRGPVLGCPRTHHVAALAAGQQYRVRVAHDLRASPTRGAAARNATTSDTAHRSPPGSAATTAAAAAA